MLEPCERLTLEDLERFLPYLMSLFPDEHSEMVKWEERLIMSFQLLVSPPASISAGVEGIDFKLVDPTSKQPCWHIAIFYINNWRYGILGYKDYWIMIFFILEKRKKKRKYMFTRPGVAGAVLKIPLSLTHKQTNSLFLFLKIFKTPSLPEILRECLPPYMCHMSHFTCHMSHFTYYV